jgi:hypothetical protein
MQHCGPCPTTGNSDAGNHSYSSEEAERLRKAGEADQRGLGASNRGDWQEAVNSFMEALELAPEDNAIRSHLHRAEQRLSDSKSAEEITALHRRIQDAIYAADIKAQRKMFEDAVNRPVNPPERAYTFAGNGLIAGGGWRLFASRKPGEPVKKMCDIIKQQSKFADSPFDAGVDCEHYQFVLGIADTFDWFTDLTHREIFDELTNGNFSAGAQGLYNILRGKRFNELGCHSNGAMICLAALEKQDVKAEHVVLYGPQITRESLAMWDQLVRDRHVRSIKVYLNENDIVPALAIRYADHEHNDQYVVEDRSLFQIDSLKRTINEAAPRLLVQTFPCSRDKLKLECHGMAMYRLKVNCTDKPSAKTVPGTGLHGKDDLPEPPLPCDAL